MDGFHLSDHALDSDAEGIFSINIDRIVRAKPDLKSSIIQFLIRWSNRTAIVFSQFDDFRIFLVNKALITWAKSETKNPSSTGPSRSPSIKATHGSSLFQPSPISSLSSFLGFHPQLSLPLELRVAVMPRRSSGNVFDF